jgi:FHS family glucose/mannose:H+ symporter-like MFS transporter
MPSSPLRRGIAAAALHLGFLCTGALTVLLGVLLPRIAAAYSLRDSQSGLLLMVQTGGSAVGALLVRRNFGRALSFGFALTSAAGLAMAMPSAAGAMVAAALFGVGLGLAMTSTSMLIGTLFVQRRGAALTVLNLCWSIGAALCPLFLRRYGQLSLPAIALATALLAAPFAAIPLLGAPSTSGPAPRPAAGRAVPAATIAGFALLAFLYVGAERCLGNWATTYAFRVAHWSFARSDFAAACFWGALLLGRIVATALLWRMPERALFLLSTAGAGAGVTMLLTAHSAPLLLAGASCAGFWLGPIYPLIVSFLIARAGDSPNVGWGFAFAGFGGSVLPWITGLLSSAFHSLRIGLLVPAAAALLLWLFAPADEDAEPDPSVP